MRSVVFILFVVLLIGACKGKRVSIFDNSRNDTIQFTYLYSEALKNKMLGRGEIAFKQFEQCLQLKPESSASAYQLAIILYDSLKYNEAKKYAEFCLKIQPKNEWYILLRAGIAKNLNQTDVVINDYQNLIKLFPENYNYKYELAIIYFENKRFNESLDLLNSLEEVLGLNENVSFLKNNVNYELKRFDAIQLELVKLNRAFPDSTKYSDLLAEFYLNINQPEKALNLYSKILEKDNGNINANFGISWIYGKLGQCSKGYNHLLIALNDNNSAFNRKFELAKIYYTSTDGRLSEDSIIKIYDLLYNDPDKNGDFVTEYISYLYQTKNLSEAEKIALVAIEKYPDSYTAWELYFNILIIQNRPEALNKYAKKALEYFPNHANIYFFCGYSNFLIKNYKGAVNYLEMGIDYVIENEDLEKQFYLTLAESYHSLGKNSKSDEYFEKYLKKDSTNAYLMNNYAYYMVQRNFNLEKALTLSRKSIEIEPFNSSFLDTYSWILYSVGEINKSLNYIQRAYKYGGNKNAVILEHYGDILYKSGNTAEAIEKWRDAYNINKSNSLMDKINKFNANGD